jgi:hypothetical protein
MVNLLSLGGGLETGEELLETGDPVYSSQGRMPLLLLRPGVPDQVFDVPLQGVLQLLPHRRGISSRIPVEHRERCRFLRDNR